MNSNHKDHKIGDLVYSNMGLGMVSKVTPPELPDRLTRYTVDWCEGGPYSRFTVIEIDTFKRDLKRRLQNGT